MPAFRLLLSLLAFALLVGCRTTQVTPSPPAPFRELAITPAKADQLTDFDIAEQLRKRPTAAFPATVAMARIQGAGYRSHTAVGWGMGTATLYPVREAVTPEQLERIAALPHLAGLAQLNRLVVPERIDDAVALRSAAAAVHADMLLGYTFDTTFGSKTLVPALGVITLGLFPNERARVTSRAAAALLDTRTGYVYGLAEATERVEQLANAWTTEDAIDDARQRAERDAFASLVGELETMWTGVVARHAGRPADVPTDAASPDLRPAPPGATYPAGP